MKNIVFLICILTAFISCDDNAHSSSSDTNDNQATALNQQQSSLSIPPSAPTFYKRYEGTVANEEVVVYLQKKDSNLTGNYYYKKTGRPIAVSGNTTGDSLSLEEFDNTAYYHNKNQNPVWRCIFNGNTINGKWIDAEAKKSFDIRLKEAESDHVFELKEFSDSIAAFDNDATSPKAHAAYEFPSMTGADAEAIWFNNEIRKMLGLQEGDLKTAVKKENDSFFADYRKEIAEFKKEYEGDEYLGSWNYDESYVSNIHYDDQGFVVVENNSYAYMGGAHGNYTSIYYNYDVERKKLLQLEDVISIDSISLQKILELRFRKDYNLPEPKPLTEIIFEKHLAITGNFYITGKGLGFLYNPYEVASYAQGPMEVFVPYAVLGDYLTVDFKKRMKL